MRMLKASLNRGYKKRRNKSFKRKSAKAKFRRVKHLKSNAVTTCPKCDGPMRLNKPKANQTWQTFWGCLNFKITGCKGTRKYIADEMTQESLAIRKADDLKVTKPIHLSSAQSQQQKLEIVKKNKQGEYFVNKGIMDGANGTLSVTDVLDLIDEALDNEEYPEEIMVELDAFGDKLLGDAAFEKELLDAPTPKIKKQKPVVKLEEAKVYKKPDEHKAATRTARSFTGKVFNNPLDDKRKRKILAEQARLKFKKPKFLITPMSNVSSNTKKCPVCNGPMRKREPKADQSFKAFFGCANYPRCKGTRKI